MKKNMTEDEYRDHLNRKITEHRRQAEEHRKVAEEFERRLGRLNRGEISTPTELMAMMEEIDVERRAWPAWMLQQLETRQRRRGARREET